MLVIRYVYMICVYPIMGLCICTFFVYKFYSAFNTKVTSPLVKLYP